MQKWIVEQFISIKKVKGEEMGRTVTGAVTAMTN